MPRNPHHPNDLRDHAGERRSSAEAGGSAGAPPPLPVTAPAADPALGWAGWNAAGILPWPGPAEAFGRNHGGGEGERDRPRREPRQR